MSADLSHTVVRLLAQTQSENDNEALAAMRKANELVAKANKSWYDMIHEYPTSNGMPPKEPNGNGSAEPKEYDEGDDWDDVIAHILKTQKWIRPGSREFLENVAEAFTKYGRLTTKQAAAVRKFMK